MPGFKLFKRNILLVLLLISFFFFYSGYYFLQPASQMVDNSVGKIIHIKPGSTINQIAKQLKQEQIINNRWAFKIYLRLTGQAPRVKAGYYRLDSGMSIIEISNKLVVGKMATYQLTIPEGATIEKIADLLVVNNFDKERFLNLAQAKDLSFIKDDKNVFYSLEGFLFPDTYNIPYDSSAKKIISIMLKEFKEKIKPFQSQIANSDYSLSQIITIASLIQAEVKLKQEAPLISSVIYNRLEKRMRLQIDASVQYALDEHKSRLLYSDLKVDSPYNTYQNYGLPPGPINSPGLIAIKAALNPAETNYLYYVAVGGGEHKFTKTYQEHLKVKNEVKD